MNDRLIAVFDAEVSYASALSDCINRNKKAGLMSYAFSDTEKLRVFLKKNTEAYLLAGMGFDTGLLPDNFNIRHITVITESMTNVPDVHWIYKYQSARAIMDELLEHLCENNQVESDAKKMITGIINLGSIEDDDCDYMISEKQDGVLILDMRLFQQPDEGMDSISDVIYYIEQGDVRKAERMLMPEAGETVKLAPVRHFADQTDMSDKCVRLLSDILIHFDTSIHVFILFDISIINLLPLTEICTYIISTCKTHETTRMTEVLKNQLDVAGMSETAEKIQVNEV